MTLPDTKENAEIVYLYIKSFKWLDPLDNEKAVGHPRPGSVYRAIYNSETKTYRILYIDEQKELNGVYIPLLLMDEDHLEGKYNYLSEAYQINKENIVNLNLSEDNLVEILAWQKEKDKPIKHAVGLEAPQVTAEQIVVAAQKQQEGQEFQELGQVMMAIKEVSPELYFALGDLIYFTAEASHSRVEDSLWLIHFSKTLGAGLNVSTAMTHLKTYSSDDRRTNLNADNLLEATMCLLLENARRKMHGIE